MTKRLDICAVQRFRKVLSKREIQYCRNLNKVEVIVEIVETNDLLMVECVQFHTGIAYEALARVLTARKCSGRMYPHMILY